LNIPIANVYYLLCYAWGHADEADVVNVAELEGLENIHDLLGKVLAEGTFQLVRRGLDRGYLEVREDLAGIRGKIEVGEMVKRALRARGRVACVFEELSHDIPHNRILKSTLGALLKLPNLDRRIRDEVRTAFQKLEGVSVIRIDRQVFRQVQLDRNRRMVRFLISICALIHEHLIVDDQTGEAQFRDFREDDHQMWAVFEDFVKEFYIREQSHYSVNKSGRRIAWFDADGVTDLDRSKIPRMEADVLLDSIDRRIILDAKFHGEAFGGRGGAKKLKSGNLYQMLAYLRNREKTAPPGPEHDGILLYPVVDDPISVDIRLEGFRIQAKGIDLAQEWRGIHEDMLAAIAP